MNRVDRTVDLHRNNGLNCAQALLVAFGEPYGMNETMAGALGRPLGGGIAKTANICGYLTAALQILSLANEKSDESSSRKAVHAAVVELVQRFTLLHGHLLCKDLLGADMSTPEGAKKIADENLIAAHCFGFGRDVAQLLDDLL